MSVRKALESTGSLRELPSSNCSSSFYGPPMKSVLPSTPKAGVGLHLGPLGLHLSIGQFTLRRAVSKTVLAEVTSLDTAQFARDPSNMVIQ